MFGRISSKHISGNDDSIKFHGMATLYSLVNLINFPALPRCEVPPSTYCASVMVFYWRVSLPSYPRQNRTRGRTAEDRLT